jgi:hypothetical protein
MMQVRTDAGIAAGGRKKKARRADAWRAFL